MSRLQMLSHLLQTNLQELIPSYLIMCLSWKHFAFHV